MWRSFAADLLVRIENPGEGFTPVDARVLCGRGDGRRGAAGVPAKGSKRPRIDNTVLRRDFRHHLRVAWALIVRRTGFSSQNNKTWFAAEAELVNAVTELFG